MTSTPRVWSGAGRDRRSPTRSGDRSRGGSLERTRRSRRSFVVNPRVFMRCVTKWSAGCICHGDPASVHAYSNGTCPCSRRGGSRSLTSNVRHFPRSSIGYSASTRHRVHSSGTCVRSRTIEPGLVLQVGLLLFINHDRPRDTDAVRGRTRGALHREVCAITRSSHWSPPAGVFGALLRSGTAG